MNFSGPTRPRAAADSSGLRTHSSPVPARPRFTRTTLALGLALVLGLTGFTIGFLTLHAGPSDTGTAGDTAASLLGYWKFHAVVAATIPGTVPGAASLTVASPSTLPAGTASYVLNSATSGHSAVEWTVQETSAAPTSTELELEFAVTTGSPGTSSTITVFIETQSSVSGNVLYNFYFDAGGAALVFDHGQLLS
ncbi:MAG: hypothetical protein L3K11_06530, partial [Thermoplasmata archaeon]|nr:hypothetical protein [Thermoplasmata archaeon]